MKIITLVIIFLTLFLRAEFTRHGKTVKDSVTSLEWQDSYNSEDIKKATWSEALIYCDELILDNKSDWRVPSLNELESIVDYNKYNPATSHIFQHIVTDAYWSSTTDGLDSFKAWYVYFKYGDDGWSDKKYKGRVRCVRGEQ